MPEFAIEVSHLCKSYQRGLFRTPKLVLDNVSFQVRRGAVYGFLGPNGAGKSTTIKILLNFVRPDDGEARVLGIPSSTTSGRKQIGFLPETADYYPFLTPRRLLLIYGDIFGLPRPEIRRRVDHLLDLLGLANEKDERIGTFSKGMKQRVGIAQALLNDPELLILDEPASGLDPLGQKEIRDLILEQKKSGKTIFFSSHELSEVEAVCDEAAIIRSGQVVAQGALEELVPYREGIVVRVRGDARTVLEGEAVVEALLPAIQPDETRFIARAGCSIEDLAAHCRELKLEVISVSVVRDSLEETFLRLIRGDES